MRISTKGRGIIRAQQGAAYPAGLQYTYNAPSFPFSGRFGDGMKVLDTWLEIIIRRY